MDGGASDCRIVGSFSLLEVDVVPAAVVADVVDADVAIAVAAGADADADVAEAMDHRFWFLC